MGRGRRALLAASTAVVLVWWPAGTAADDGAFNPESSLMTQAIGSTAFMWTTITERTLTGSRVRQNVGDSANTSCGYWGIWRRLSLATTTQRAYGQIIVNSCFNDKQVFPTPDDPADAACRNDDVSGMSIRYSLCYHVPVHTVPAGQAFNPLCMDLAEEAVHLNATVSPASFDASRPTALTVTTGFDSDFSQLLDEATCSAVLGWSVTSWNLRWPDGASDTKPGSGQEGITAQHTTTAQAGGVLETAQVVACATLHITARDVEFDAATNPVVRTHAADVVICNDPAASGLATPGHSYVPPQLSIGAIPVVQNGDGSLPAYNPAATALPRAATIRGRLVQLYPRALVVSPGREIAGGAVVGTGVTTTVGWTYLGEVTDTPASESTAPGSSGAPDVPIEVQYNHASPVDAQGNPLDEPVAMRITARTVYPDGHAETQTVTGAVGVAIYYVGLNFEG